MSDLQRKRVALAFLGFALAILADLEESEEVKQDNRFDPPDVFHLRNVFDDARFLTRTDDASPRNDTKHPLVRRLGPQRLHVNMRADARRSPQVRRCNQRIR